MNYLLLSIKGSAFEIDGQTKCHRNGKRTCLWNGNKNFPLSISATVGPSISYWLKLLFKKIEILKFSFQICFWNKFLNSGRGQTEKYANMHICVFSVWPLLKVQNLFQKQIWNDLNLNVTEMDRGDFYFHFRGTSYFHFSGTWSVHQFHRHFLYIDNLHGIYITFSMLIVFCTCKAHNLEENQTNLAEILKKMG